MNIEQIEMRSNWPVYHNVPFEKAELQEISDYVSEVGAKLTEGITDMANKIHDALKPFLDSFRNFISHLPINYRSEEYILVLAPDHWIKWEYGED